MHIEKSDQHKTAFASMHFESLLFGLCNKSTTRQRAIKILFARYRWRTSVLYLNGVIAVSATFEDRVRDNSDNSPRRGPPSEAEEMRFLQRHTGLPRTRYTPETICRSRIECHSHQRDHVPVNSDSDNVVLLLLQCKPPLRGEVQQCRGVGHLHLRIPMNLN